MEECEAVIIKILITLSSTDDQINLNKILEFCHSKMFIIVLHGSFNKNAYERYSQLYTDKIDELTYLQRAGIEIDSESTFASHMSLAGVWIFIMLVMLSYAKTGNIESCYTRVQSAFKQSGLEVPRIFHDYFTKMILNIRTASIMTSGIEDAIQIYHTSLWSFPTYAIGEIKSFFDYKPTSLIATGAVSQIMLVYDYAQMTFIKNIKEFMTTASSAARVLRSVVSEYMTLLRNLNSIKMENPNVYEGHFRLLRVKGFEKLESGKYPHLSAIVMFILED